MIRIFFGRQNLYQNLYHYMSHISNKYTQRYKIFDFMREIAEDVDFEEIEVTHEERETEDIIQIIE